MNELLNALIEKQQGKAIKPKASAKTSSSSLRRAITELAAQENALVPAERRVSPRAVATVAARSLTASASLPRQTRYFMAYRDVAAFLQLAIHNKKRDTAPVANLDLLPVGHPLSMRTHAMTASAYTMSVARWIAADPRVSDEARTLVAAAYIAKSESAERAHAVARLSAMTAGAVPQEIIVSLSAFDDFALIADGRVNRFRGGNSRAARSFRARKQNRDRKKQFASGYSGIQFFISMPGNKKYSIVGQFVANTDGYEGFQVEVKNDPVVGDAIVDVPSAYAEAIKAFIPLKKGAPAIEANPPGDVPVLDWATATKHDMPNGWELVRTRQEGETGPDRVYRTADGYEVAYFDEGRTVEEIDKYHQKIDETWADYKTTWSEDHTWEADPEPIYKPAYTKKVKTFKEAKPTWSPDDPTLFVSRQDTDRTKGKLIGMTQSWGDATAIIELDEQKFDTEYDAAPVGENGPSTPEATTAPSAPQGNLDPDYEDVTDEQLAKALTMQLGQKTRDQVKIDKLTNELKARGVQDIPGLEAPTDVSAPAGESGKGQAAAPSVQWSVPEGAHALKKPEWFDPEGRIDEESNDFTDDPEVLANKFNDQELKDALAEALRGKSDFADEFLEQMQQEKDAEDDEEAPKKKKPGPKKKQPAKVVEGTGNGRLPFDAGDEYVPAEALYLALQKRGVDVDKFVAELYDAGTGETKNMDMLDELRRGESVQAQGPETIVDEFDKEPADTSKTGDTDEFGFVKQEDGTWEIRPTPDISVYYGQKPDGEWYFGYQKFDENGDVVGNEELPADDKEFARILADGMAQDMAKAAGVDEAPAEGKVRDVAKDPDAALREVNQSSVAVEQIAALMGEPDRNPRINEIAESIRGTSNELQDVLEEHIGLLFSDDPNDLEAFRSLWGVFMSLDGGFVKNSARLPESMWGDPLRDAAEEFTGRNISWEELGGIISDKLGWAQDWKKNKTDIANGDVQVADDNGLAALSYRLIAQTALPNATKLYRGIQAIVGSNKESTYTTEGNIVDFDPRSYSTKLDTAESFASTFAASSATSSIIFTIKPGDSLASDVSSISPFTEETESLAFGKYRIAKVTKGDNGFGRDVYTVELERVADGETPAANEDYSGKLIKNGDYAMPEGYYEPDTEPYRMMDEIDPGMPEGFTDSPAYIAETWDTQDLEDALAGGILDGTGKAVLEYPIDGGFIAQVDVEAIRDALQIQGVDTNELISGIAEGDLTPDEVADATDVPAESTFDAPMDISAWKKVGGQKGSNTGGTYEDEKGNYFYVKYPKSDLHAENEALASKLYELFDIQSAQQLLGRDGDGKLVTVSPLIPNAKSNLEDKLEDPEYKKKLQEGLAVDALLANWDVAGLVYDNVVTNEDGEPVRVDPGGALLFRAMGAPKGGAFGDEVTEMDTFRDPDKNERTFAVFGDMTPEQVTEAADRLRSVSQADIDALVDGTISDPEVAAELKKTLAARRDDILTKFGSDGGDGGNPPTPPTGGNSTSTPNYRVDMDMLTAPDEFIYQLGLPDGDYTSEEFLDEWLKQNGLDKLGVKYTNAKLDGFGATVDFEIPEAAKGEFAKAYRGDDNFDDSIDEGIEPIDGGDGGNPPTPPTGGNSTSTPNYRVDMDMLTAPDEFIYQLGLPDGDYTSEEFLDEWLKQNGLDKLGVKYTNAKLDGFGATVDFEIPEAAKGEFAKAYRGDDNFDDSIDEGIEPIDGGDGGNPPGGDGPGDGDDDEELDALDKVLAKIGMDWPEYNELVDEVDSWLNSPKGLETSSIPGTDNALGDLLDKFIDYPEDMADSVYNDLHELRQELEDNGYGDAAKRVERIMDQIDKDYLGGSGKSGDDGEPKLKPSEWFEGKKPIDQELMLDWTPSFTEGDNADKFPEELKTAIANAEKARADLKKILDDGEKSGVDKETLGDAIREYWGTHNKMLNAAAANNQLTGVALGTDKYDEILDRVSEADKSNRRLAGGNVIGDPPFVEPSAKAPVSPKPSPIDGPADDYALDFVDMPDGTEEEKQEFIDDWVVENGLDEGVIVVGFKPNGDPIIRIPRELREKFAEKYSNTDWDTLVEDMDLTPEVPETGEEIDTPDALDEVMDAIGMDWSEYNSLDDTVADWVNSPAGMAKSSFAGKSDVLSDLLDKFRDDPNNWTDSVTSDLYELAAELQDNGFPGNARRLYSIIDGMEKYTFGEDDKPLGVVTPSETPEPVEPEAPLGVVPKSETPNTHTTGDGVPIVVGMEVVYKKTGESVTVIKLDKGNAGYVYVKMQDGTIKNKSTKQLIGGGGNDGGSDGGDGGSPEAPTEPSPSGESQTTEAPQTETPDVNPAQQASADAITDKQKSYLNDLIKQKKVTDQKLFDEIAGLLMTSDGIDKLSKKDASRLITELVKLENGGTAYFTAKPLPKPDASVPPPPPLPTINANPLEPGKDGAPSPAVDKFFDYFVGMFALKEISSGKIKPTGFGPDMKLYYEQKNDGADSTFWKISVGGGEPEEIDSAEALAARQKILAGENGWRDATPVEKHALTLKAEEYDNHIIEVMNEMAAGNAGTDSATDKVELTDKILKLLDVAGPDGVKNIAQTVAISESLGMLLYTDKDNNLYIYDFNKKTVDKAESYDDAQANIEMASNGEEGLRPLTRNEEKLVKNMVSMYGGEFGGQMDLDDNASGDDSADDSVGEPPAGAPTITDSTGGQVWAGLEIVDKKGEVGSVLKVNKDNYAYVQFADGSKGWRSGKAITATGNVGKSAKPSTSKPNTNKVTPAGTPPIVVDGPVDWSTSGLDNVPSLEQVIKDVTSGRVKGIGGGSAAVDSDSIEDLDVRVMHVRDANGVDGVRLKYKLTAWAGNALAKKLLSMDQYELAAIGFVNSGVRIERIDVDENGVGNLSADQFGYSTYGGKTWRLTTPDGIVITFTRANTVATSTISSGSPRAFHNMVQIQAPVGATAEQLANAMAMAGVGDVRPATPADAQVLIENRLMSIFDQETDATTNLKGDERANSLKRIQEKFGITVDDVKIITGAGGRIEMELSDEAIDVIMEKTGNPKAIQHNVTLPHGDWGMSAEDREKLQAEWLADFLATPQGGLLSTTVRWSEGVGGSGMSSDSDVNTGGADYVFMKPLKEAKEWSSGGTFMYFDPRALYKRLDFYANYYDNYGARKKNHNVLDAAKVGAYELMFKQRVSFDALDTFFVHNEQMRQSVINLLHSRGITEIGGRPVEQVIRAGGTSSVTYNL